MKSFVSVIAGVVIGVSVGIFTSGGDLVDPCNPYNTPQVNSLEWVSEDSILVSANFVKNSSTTFKDLKVYGQSYLEWESLPWQDVTGAKGDRLAGEQTLKINVGSEREKFAKYEIRTRHICAIDNSKVDKVFLRFTENEIK